MDTHAQTSTEIADELTHTAAAMFAACADFQRTGNYIPLADAIAAHRAMGARWAAAYVSENAAKALAA